MSALEELRSGKTGDDFLALLQRTVSAVARTGLYPAPGGRAHWDKDAVRTVVAEFLASKQSPRRLTDLRTHCRTEHALKARLQRTIKNFLADSGRRTPVGRLVRRFNEVLATDPQFERDGVYWRLAGTTDEPVVVDFERLLSVVAGVEVHVPAAWLRGHRKSPDIDGASVLRVARAALDTAGGPLRPADLAQLAARRLGLGTPPLSLEAAAFEPVPPAHRSSDVTGSEALVMIRAHEVFSRLNTSERLSIGQSRMSVEALGEALGVSGSKAHLIRKRAVAILQDELGEEEDGQAVAEALFEIARIWSEVWMTGHGPT
jgi:hypothetical protein